MNDWKCPECQGPHLDGLRFRHDPANCALSRAEDATAAADHDRAGWLPFERPATPTELRLAEVVRGYPLYRAAQFHAPGEPAPEGERLTTVVSFVGGLRHRVVAGLDPDVIAAES